MFDILIAIIGGSSEGSSVGLSHGLNPSDD